MASAPKRQRRRKWTEATILPALRDFFANTTSEHTPSLERDNQPLLGGARRVIKLWRAGK